MRRPVRAERMQHTIACGACAPGADSAQSGLGLSASGKSACAQGRDDVNPLCRTGQRADIDPVRAESDQAAQIGEDSVFTTAPGNHQCEHHGHSAARAGDVRVYLKRNIMAAQAVAAAIAALGLVTGAFGALATGNAADLRRRALKNLAGMPGVDIGSVTDESLQNMLNNMDQATAISRGASLANQLTMQQIIDATIPGYEKLQT